LHDSSASLTYFDSINIPQLRSLARTERSPSVTADWASFEQRGDPIPLELPKLETVNGTIIFRGNFSSFVLTSSTLISAPCCGARHQARNDTDIRGNSLSLPRLKTVTHKFEVEVDSDLSIDLPLESAGDTLITGKIERYGDLAL
jgi:hypothetical protein